MRAGAGPASRSHGTPRRRSAWRPISTSCPPGSRRTFIWTPPRMDSDRAPAARTSGPMPSCDPRAVRLPSDSRPCDGIATHLDDGVTVPKSSPASPDHGLMEVAPDVLLHLTAAGVSVVLDATEGRLPSIVHWGASLGPQSAESVSALAAAAEEPA